MSTKLANAATSDPQTAAVTPGRDMVLAESTLIRIPFGSIGDSCTMHYHVREEGKSCIVF